MMKNVFTVLFLFVAVTIVQAQVKEGVKYQIVNKSGRVLDVHKSSKDNGANVQLWDNKNIPGQQFTFVNATGGYYYIKNVNSGKALDFYKGVDKRKTNVTQYQINLTNAQRFKIVNDKDGYVYIMTKGGNCLSSETVHGQRGSNVLLWSKNDVARWKLVEVKK